MQLSFRLDKRPGESHLALDGKKGVPWSPLLCRWLLRGRRSIWCSARGRMYALASLALRWLLHGRRSTCCSARGRMYALACFGLRRSAGSFWHWLLCNHLGQRKNGRDVFAKTKPSPSYTKPKKADKSSLKRWWRNASVNRPGSTA